MNIQNLITTNTDENTIEIIELLKDFLEKRG